MFVNTYILVSKYQFIPPFVVSGSDEQLLEMASVIITQVDAENGQTVPTTQQSVPTHHLAVSTHPPPSRHLSIFQKILSLSRQLKRLTMYIIFLFSYTYSMYVYNKDSYIVYTQPIWLFIVNNISQYNITNKKYNINQLLCIMCTRITYLKQKLTVGAVHCMQQRERIERILSIYTSYHINILDEWEWLQTEQIKEWFRYKKCSAFESVDCVQLKWNLKLPPPPPNPPSKGLKPWKKG